MPDFYLVPYPTGQNPGKSYPRRSKTEEYSRTVYKPCINGKLTLAGYRWALYLFGGEKQASVRTSATDKRFDALLSRREGDREAFRSALINEGYTDLTDREVEFNVYAPHDMFPHMHYPLGRKITEDEAKEYIRRFPLPRWIDRDSSLYNGWDLNPYTWEPHINMPSHASSSPFAQPRAHGRDGKSVAATVEMSLTEKDREAIMNSTCLVAFVLDEDGQINSQLWAEWKSTIQELEPLIVDLNYRVQQATYDQSAPKRQAPATPSAMRDRFAYHAHKEGSQVAPVEVRDSDNEMDDIFRSSPYARSSNKRQREESDAVAPSDKPTSEATIKYLNALVISLAGTKNPDNAINIDPTCPAMAVIRAGVNLPEGAGVVLALHNIALTMMYDQVGLAVLVPTSTVKTVVNFVAFVQKLDKGDHTMSLPVTFILRHLLHVHLDFGISAMVYKPLDEGQEEDGWEIDQTGTFAAWKGRHGAKITLDAVEQFKRRLLAMRQYISKNGVVKAYALLDDEVVALADAVDEEELLIAFGEERSALDLDLQRR